MIIIVGKNSSQKLSKKVIAKGQEILEFLADTDTNELEGAYACANVAAYLLTVIAVRNNLSLQKVKELLCGFISDSIDLFFESLLPKDNEMNEIIKTVKWEE